MTINLLLIAYFLFLLFSLGGAFAIIYHLKANKLSEKFSTITILLFVVGFLFALTFNVSNAIQIDWSSLTFNFSAIQGDLDFKDSFYE